MTYRRPSFSVLPVVMLYRDISLVTLPRMTLIMENLPYWSEMVLNTKAAAEPAGIVGHLDSVAVAALSGLGGHIGSHGHQVHDGLHQHLHAHTGDSAAAQHGAHAALAHADLQALGHVLGGQLHGLEELLHQLLIGAGGGLHQLSAEGLHLVRPCRRE